MNRRLLAWPLMAVLLVVAWWAVPRGLADVYGRLLQAHIDSWTQSRRVPDEAEWQKARGLFDRALGWTPGDPSLLQQGGRLYEWGALVARPTREARARRAMDYLRASLQRRPAWPYAWAELAEVMARFGQTGDDFQQAFARALETGPWEQDVQLSLAQAGFMAFKQLSQKNRAALARILQRAARGPAVHELIRLADQADSLWILCVLASDQPPVKRACAS